MAFIASSSATIAYIVYYFLFNFYALLRLNLAYYFNSV